LAAVGCLSIFAFSLIFSFETRLLLKISYV
jgi:hypothetical protein